MKLKDTCCLHSTRVFVLSITMMAAQPCFSATMPVPVKRSIILSGEDEPASKVKSKTFSSRNNVSVKIYPDAMKKIMHVIAKENNGKQIDFFVFDMQGTLMRNYKMKAKDHIKIAGLQRGAYVYRVFCGDEETAAGNFEIR
jgi:hypothetical protein